MKKPPRAALGSRAKQIKLIGMDVDGVLTAGDIVVLESGEEVKFWSSKDRFLMAILRDMKSPPILAWITGRSSRAVAEAGKDLGVRYVIQGCKDKKKALLELLSKNKLGPHQAAFIGDDLIDLPALRTVGLAACPADAVDEVQQNVHYISPLAGGKGVFRDVLKMIFQAQKKWEPIVASWRD